MAVYTVPSMVSSSPSLIHVTMVAGEPVETHVKLGELNVSEVIFGVAGGNNTQNCTVQNTLELAMIHYNAILYVISHI